MLAFRSGGKRQGSTEKTDPYVSKTDSKKIKILIKMKVTRLQLFEQLDEVLHDIFFEHHQRFEYINLISHL